MSDVYIAGQGLAQADHSIDYPRPDRLVQGNPKRETASMYAHPNMDCGIWQCEVGAWNIVFAPNKQEFFTILEGLVRIYDQQGGYIEVSAGQAGIIPPSFQGKFEVVEAVKKYYVVVEV
ncbi:MULTISPECIES: cupin domain-containing protein [unclassified Acinetobacter]|uniref:cupin domain-containing protein n=1 Tax=unclassified Acinetobacter TaxID=196816 RepID=UPI0015D2A4DF|nr:MULTISPECIES: cupin domain-containing protein [unclassified Acinetobacter]